MAKQRKTRGKTTTGKRSRATAGSVDMPHPNKPSEDWEAKDALRTLTRGFEIRANKGLMGRVHKHAKAEQQAHARVLRLQGKEL